jgi:hypothetical protein
MGCRGANPNLYRIGYLTGAKGIGGLDEGCNRTFRTRCIEPGQGISIIPPTIAIGCFRNHRLGYSARNPEVGTRVWLSCWRGAGGGRLCKKCASITSKLQKQHNCKSVSLLSNLRNLELAGRRQMCANAYIRAVL